MSDVHRLKTIFQGFEGKTCRHATIEFKRNFEVTMGGRGGGYLKLNSRMFLAEIIPKIPKMSCSAREF